MMQRLLQSGTVKVFPTWRLDVNRKHMILFLLFVITFGLVSGIGYCRIHHIRSYDDWVNRNLALAIPSPVIRAINSGDLARGASVVSLMQISIPSRHADFGRLKYYWFRPDAENSQLAIFVDDRLTTVVASGDHFSWIFFDDPNPELITAMQKVRLIRDLIADDPALKESLEAELEPALLTLGLPLEQPLPSDP